MGKQRLRPSVSDERGGTLALMAVSIVVLVGILAFAIDLGMLFVARSEAQRAADAGALAGASAFLEMDPAEAAAPAETRATDYATRNALRGSMIDPGEVTVDVVTADEKVRVWVNRDGIPTWFARVIGISDVPVGAMAAAQASGAGSAKCMKPFAVPDIWHDADDDENGDHVWDEGESWEFEPGEGDFYKRYSEGGSGDMTGYGSDWRSDVENDYGRQIDIKPTDPNSEFTLEPSVFFPFRLPTDPDQESCDQGGGGSQPSGGATYRRNICSCNQSSVELGEPYEVQTGNMVGPTYQGIDELISEDPNATWTNGEVTGSKFDDWMQSPRVVKIALFNPEQVTGPGMQEIEFNNFALMFIEEQQSPQDPVTGRFLYYATGDGGGPTTGSLVKFLRLVE